MKITSLTMLLPLFNLKLKPIRLCWLIVIWLALNIGSATLVRAQNIPVANQPITLTAIPTRLGDEGELKTQPGKTIQVSVKVRNASDHNLTIASGISDFILAEDGATPIPVDSQTSGRWSLSSWSTIANPIQEIGAHQTKTVDLLISVPADALPGGRYAMIAHEPMPTGTTQDELDSAGSASHVTQKVGTLIYLLVDGPVNEEAFVRVFNWPKFTEYGPVPYSFVVDNLSDLHIRPQIGIEIFNLFGRRIDAIQVETKNVFPLIPRPFEGHWNRIWGIGPYRAVLTMNYGQQGNVIITKTVFWLLPIKLLIFSLILIVALFVMILAIIRYLKRRQSQEQQKIDILEEKLKHLEQEQTKV